MGIIIMNKQLLLVVLSAVLLPLMAHSEEQPDAAAKVQELIGEIVTAYGGDSLTNLTSFHLEDRVLSTTIGQGRTPDLLELNRIHQVLKVDISNSRTSYESWANGRGGDSVTGTLSDGETAQNLNYQTNSYGAASSADPYTFAGGFMRTTDAILVYEMQKVSDKVTLIGEADYMNRTHLKVSMPFPQSPDLTLFVDKETKLISKMQRVTGFGNLDYIYRDHHKRDGIVSAGRFEFYVKGEPNLISVAHTARFNQQFSDEDFALPDGMREEGERVDASQMMVNKITDQVYHVGQNGGFSLFVDTGNGIVSAGGYPGLQTRFDRFREESSNFQPLAYQIVTHHHNDHIGGLAEATALGAKLVTVDENVETIKNGVIPAPEDWQLMTVGARAVFGQGKDRVEVFNVSTTHSKDYLLVYVPAAKTVFMADHLGSPYKTGIPVGNLNTVTMFEAIEALDLDVKKIATAHNGRIFTYKEMQASVKGFVAFSCEGKRAVCED